jgi:penicillin-insensitive murein endopeptidase
MRCPSGSPDCHGQPEQDGGDGCDDLGYWFKDSVLHPEPPKVPPKPPPPMTLAQLPPACRQVLNAPDSKP